MFYSIIEFINNFVRRMYNLNFKIVFLFTIIDEHNNYINLTSLISVFFKENLRISKKS